ncbi:MAG: phosphomethylpyrimidine synthase ThiC [bacterium]
MDKSTIKAIARSEGLKPAELTRLIDSGRVVLLRNRKRKIKPVAVGEKTRVKVNANIGTSPDRVDVETELEKLRVAIAAGADTVMDLSVGGDVDEIRQEIIRNSPVPIGTVPIYQVALTARQHRRSFTEVPVKDIFKGIEKHLADGVDFITVHCGITRKNLTAVRPRLGGVVSRGGVMIIEWMKFQRRENPLYEHFDELLTMAKDFCATLSLGDGLRPGAIADATDEAQIAELITIGELVQQARAAGVQVMVEGPGHIPIDQIAANIHLEKTLCDRAPFYVLGPLVTDIACGYDHITAAIGGAIAAYHGADFLCYVTPSEHLGLPDVEDVREGVIASRIAAHAADIARHHPGAIDWDNRLSRFRANLQWQKMITHSLDPERARAIFAIQPSHTKGACTMCGEFCAVKKTKEKIL